MTQLWVVDTGPLSHFARAGWLGVLRLLAPDRLIIVPDTVERELRAGLARRPWLQPILDHDWIRTQPLTDRPELLAYAHYAQRLVGDDGRNTGECGVLALAEVHGHVAVLDDQAGVRLGKARAVAVRRTLGLLCDAIQEGHLTAPMVSALADDLLETDYRLPFPRGGFIRWAQENGRIPPA